MNVTYDQRLQDYMRAKGYCAVVFQEVSAIGCCADSSELYSRFAKAPEAEKLRAQGTWRIVADFYDTSLASAAGGLTPIANR